MGAVHRHALRLVDGRGIAVVDAIVVLEVESDGTAIVSLHGHALRADLFDGAERAILHTKTALVLQEHDAIPCGEVSFAALHRHAHVLAKIARFPHPVAGRLVEFPHLRIGVHVEILRQLDQRLLALDRGCRHLRLEGRVWFRRGRLPMVFSSLATSCCPIAGKLIHWINFWPGSYAENPLIPAVQISGATFVLRRYLMQAIGLAQKDQCRA